MFALGQEVENVEIFGKPGITPEEVEAKVMQNTLPILITAIVGFYVIYRLLK